MLNISNVTYSLHVVAKRHNLIISRAQCSEIFAAYLGYNSLAALRAEEADESLYAQLVDAEIIILNQHSGAERINSLSRQSIPDDIVETFIIVIINSLSEMLQSCKVFKSVTDFYHEYVTELLSNSIAESDDWGTATSELNAEFSDNPEMSDQFIESGDLWKAPDEWSIEAKGSAVGSYEDIDRYYNGHKIDCWGQLTFYKAGRAGLIFSENAFSAGASDEDLRDDDDWLDPDDVWSE